MKFLRAILNKTKKSRIRNTNKIGTRGGLNKKRHSKEQIVWTLYADKRRQANQCEDPEISN